MKRIFFLLFVLSLILCANAQENALWMRYPSISPDGQKILFSFKGDIYIVPVSGGTATPLTIVNLMNSLLYGAMMEKVSPLPPTGMEISMYL
jgi:hypothetical protein